MTLSPGLVSVTFRQLSVPEVVELAAQAGLAAVEWGGDVHVPHGDLEAARAARRSTEDAGLRVAAYGSYYRAGHPDTGPFDAVLSSAVELDAPCIRIWAGTQGTDTADDAYWDDVVADIRRIADQAQAAGVDVVLEFHRNTLTDTADSTVRLLQRVDHPAVYTYWQPPRHSQLEDNLAALDAVAPWVYGLHVFAWHEETGERLPLADRADHWRQYLQRANALDRDLYALLEFVQDDAPSHFVHDAQTLVALLSEQAAMTG